MAAQLLYSSPKQIGALTTWSKIDAWHASMAIKTDGTMWSWGRNNYGQLGLGDTTNRSSPVQVGASSNWLNIAAGTYGNHAVAIKTDGTLWTWGQNNNNQLGLGDTTSRSSPVQVGALTTWLRASGGNYYMTAIKS
jgi:alpha-tubulin suppressor-like RCC1 family protein